MNSPKHCEQEVVTAFAALQNGRFSSNRLQSFASHDDRIIIIQVSVMEARAPRPNPTLGAARDLLLRRSCNTSVPLHPTRENTWDRRNMQEKNSKIIDIILPLPHLGRGSPVRIRAATYRLIRTAI
eukprot:scpid81490/ scgid9506/ 